MRTRKKTADRARSFWFITIFLGSFVKETSMSLIQQNYPAVQLTKLMRITVKDDYCQPLQDLKD